MAQKSKGFRSLLKQQKTINNRETALNAFEQKLQQSELGNDFQDIVKNPKGEVKMSDVLEEFVEPYLPEASGLNQRKMLFEMAIIAWNLALMPESQRQSALEDLINQAIRKKNPRDQQDMRNLLDEMVTRKLQLFSANQRYILDYQLEDIGDQFHLSVASTLAPKS
jgi:hypothetical protein